MQVRRACVYVRGSGTHYNNTGGGLFSRSLFDRGSGRDRGMKEQQASRGSIDRTRTCCRAMSRGPRRIDCAPGTCTWDPARTGMGRVVHASRGWSGQISVRQLLRSAFCRVSYKRARRSLRGPRTHACMRARVCVRCCAGPVPCSGMSVRSGNHSLMSGSFVP
jgi:hypothetical protein